MSNNPKPQMNEVQFNAMLKVAADVARERERQHGLWGEQSHPDGTGPQYRSELEDARRNYEYASQDKKITWALILLEEVFEVLVEEDDDKIRKELEQVAGVAQAWIEAIDRRKKAAK